MDKKEINELLLRYKNGICSPEEKNQLESWYNMLAETGSWTWTEDEKIEIGQAIKLQVDDQLIAQKASGLLKSWIWAAAASVLLLLSIGLAMFHNRQTTATQNIYAETIVAPGKQARIILSDGSVVFLNGSSKISYLKNFAGAVREVTLIEGEAFFDVKHDADKPFIVKTNSVSIRVLGTAFNVRSYSGMEDTRVTVARGKVAVKETIESGTQDQVLLLPDEQVSINKHSGNLQKSHIDSKSITSWMDGKLIFDNESLENIAITLHHARNISLSFSDPSIKAIHCTAGFDNKDDMETIVSALSSANNLSYTIKDNIAVLKRIKR